MKSIKSRLVLFFSFMISITLIVVISVLVLNFSNIIVNLSEASIKEKAKDVAMVIEEKIQGELGALEVEAIQEGLFDGTLSEDELMKELEIYKEKMNYLDLLWIDGEGNVHGVNSSNINMSEYNTVLKQALRGEKVFGQVKMIKGQDLLIASYAVPIEKTGVVSGVLLAIKDAEFLNDYIYEIKYGQKGYACIVNSAGTIVAHPDKQLVAIGDNAIQASLTDESKRELGNIKKDMIKGENGSGQYFYDGIDKLMGYAPINGTQLFLGITAPTSENLSMRDKELRLAIYISIIALMFMIFLTFLIGKYIAEPLRVFTKKMKNFDPEDQTLKLEETVYSLIEIDTLAQTYYKIIKKLRENFEMRAKKEWQQNGQMELNYLIRNNNSLQKLSNEIISFLTKQVNGKVGVLYLADQESEEVAYKLSSSYAYQKRKASLNYYKMGEGCIGQAALEGELVVISNLSIDYMAIDSGLGDMAPKNSVVLPCAFNDRVIAVVEIGFTHEIDEQIIEYLESVKNHIAISLNNVMNLQSVKNLLKKTKEQSEELQQQQEELQVSNEELREQTTMLENSQAELESQQEELRVINEELEQNAKQLEIQAEELNKKNNVLEQTQKEVEGKAKDLEVANVYKSEFLANMSHELRTPLNSILILSELLGENNKGNLNSKDVEFAKTINKSGKDLLKLINDILDLSKVEAGKTEVHNEIVILDEFLVDLSNLFKPVALNKNIEFLVNKMGVLPEKIYMDEQKVNQIIKNLLANAFKFTETGSVQCNVDMVDEKIEFQVIDSGIGIDQEKIGTIFEAFKQEDGTTSRKYGGTGLGLSISKEYVKLLKGIITVESKKGVGSKFILSIPVQTVGDRVGNGELKINEAKGFQSKDALNEIESKDSVYYSPEDVIYLPDDREQIEENDKVVLIVDDDANFASVIMSICRDKGFKVVVAETGEHGLYLADYYQLAAIILDIGLPGIDGWQVVDKLNENSRTMHTPVYIISGKEKEENRSLKGALKYFTKPIAKDQINKILLETKIFGKDKLEKVMVIEDDDKQRKTIVELLKQNYEDLEIQSCSAGNEALSILNQENYDLLILDLGLNDYNEFEFVEKLKSDEAHKELPIIIYTGQEISTKDEKFLRERVVDIIIKGDESARRLIDEIKLFTYNVSKGVEDGCASKDIMNEIYNGKKILVVDDDMRNVFALSSILESNGMDIVIANDGEEALDLLDETEDIDLVLMDIMMPKMDGYEAMRSIRKMPNFKRLPIIALTAKAMRGDRDKCIEAGATEYLSKPVDKDKLLSLLRVWLT